ncbi:MAG: DUF1638 domain-containing protein [Dehalococcoidia bacterium]
MSGQDRTEVIRLIACGVFKPALEHLQLENTFPGLKTTLMESNLHLRPQVLRQRLEREFNLARNAGEKVVCLYGNCFAGINELCEQHGVLKVPGDFCHEMLLTPERYRQCMDRSAGTYFIEQEVVQSFDEHCRIPLELDDEETRKYCFEHYQRVLYVRQPSDPEISDQLNEIATFLDLDMETQDADYSYIESNLIDLILRCR